MSQRKIIFLPGLRFHVENYIKYLDDDIKAYIFTTSPIKYFKHTNFKYVFIPQPFKIISRILKFKSNSLLKLLDSIIYQIISSIIILFINPTYIHVWGGYGFIVLKIFNKKKTILERSSSYELTQHSIIDNEYARLGINKIINLKFDKLRFLEYKLSKEIIIPSKYSYETFPNNFQKKLNLIYPISEKLSKKFNYTCNNNIIIIGYVGGNVIVKGLIHLLTQFNKLNNSYKLYLKLDKTDFSNYESHKTLIDNNDNIEIKKSDRNMTDFYNSIDCLIQPSIDDGFQLVILEALSLGIPCFVSKFSGSRDLMETLIPENIFNPYDSEQLFRILKEINKKKLKTQTSIIKNNFNDIIKNINNNNNSSYKNILI